MVTSFSLFGGPQKETDRVRMVWIGQARLVKTRVLYVEEYQDMCSKYENLRPGSLEGRVSRERVNYSTV